MIGRDAEQRIGIYEDLKREARQFDHMGHGPPGYCALGLAGTRVELFCFNIAWGYRKTIPAYASTYHGDRNGGLDSKEAFGDFALKCRDMGYRAFKSTAGTRAIQKKKRHLSPMCAKLSGMI